MAVTDISLTGQINAIGGNYTNDNAMFLKVFSGEVLQAFETATVMKPLHMVRTISSGKSAQFPLTGIATANYHTPGQDLLTDGSYVSQIKHAEKVISIDDLLTSWTRPRTTTMSGRSTRPNSVVRLLARWTST